MKKNKQEKPENRKKFNHMLAMLQKDEESRTKHDFDNITAFLGQTHIANNNGYDLDDFEKVALFKQGQYIHIPRGDKVYKRGEAGKTMYFIIKGELAVTFPTSVGTKEKKTTMIDVITNTTNLKRELSIRGGSTRSNRGSNHLSVHNSVHSAKGSSRHSQASRASRASSCRRS